VTAVPRLAYETISPSLRRQLDARVKPMGYFGESFQCAAHQPEILSACLTMTDAFKPTLPDRVIEVCGLTASGALKNEYERNQHEQFCIRLGFSSDWVASVNQLQRNVASDLNPTDSAAQRQCLAFIERDGKDVGSELNSVIEHLGAAEAIAIMFVVGRYVTHALIVNSHDLSPPVKSIFVGRM